jgi:hypothetical protein
MSFCVIYLLRERKDTVSFRTLGECLVIKRGQFDGDALIGMNELTDHDKAVLGRMFEAIGFFKGVLGDIRQQPVDHKYLGRVIADVAIHVQAIERELDEFAREWGYE